MTHPTEAEAINAAQQEQRQTEAALRHVNKLVKKAATMRVRKLKPFLYNVHSPSGNDYTVRVRLDEQMFCNCEYSKFQQDEPTEENPNPDPKPVACSHTIAVATKRAKQAGETLTISIDADRKTSKHKVQTDGIIYLTRKRAAK